MKRNLNSGGILVQRSSWWPENFKSTKKKKTRYKKKAIPGIYTDLIGKEHKYCKETIIPNQIIEFAKM